MLYAQLWYEGCGQDSETTLRVPLLCVQHIPFCGLLYFVSYRPCSLSRAVLYSARPHVDCAGGAVLYDGYITGGAFDLPTQSTITSHTVHAKNRQQFRVVIG